MEAASASAAADSSLKNGFQRETGGEKALETCGTERSESELMMTGAKAAEARTARGTIFSEQWTRRRGLKWRRSQWLRKWKWWRSTEG